jgi:hypothetical protein
MARKVTITYSSPGLQPPVYITTSLSEPQWALLEMESKESASGEWEFSRTFLAEEGEYQYKFRLGPGDWWVCDEDKPTVDDGFGDRNNVLEVKDEVPIKKQAAEPHEPVDDGAVFEAPTLPHEQNFAEEDVERDSLGDGVVRGPVIQDDGDEPHEKHAPLFSHELDGSPRNTLTVPPEDVPVNFSRQDTLALDDDEEGDCEPSHFPGAPAFSHERDVLPDRISTPGVDENLDGLDDPPLMRHETLSSDASKSPHATHGAERHSSIPTSPASTHSLAHLVTTDNYNHVPAEADPNDPSLLKLDVLSSTSPIAKSMSHSSQSPSLPSVREDEEELEVEPVEKLDTYPGRPAALMTPPRTPDESKDVKQLDSDPEDLEETTAQEPAGLKGEPDSTQSTEPENQEESPVKKAEKEIVEKASRSGMLETVLGLGLFVAVGVGAAWLAFMMQDPIKDGGAALTGAS